jgi:hypothetical protein
MDLAQQQQQQQGMAPALQPVPVETVLQTIRAAMSHVTAERAPAEAAIRAWEAEAAPGFVHSLMRIVQEHAAIDEVRIADILDGSFNAITIKELGRIKGRNSKHSCPFNSSSCRLHCWTAESSS